MLVQSIVINGQKNVGGLSRSTLDDCEERFSDTLLLENLSAKETIHDDLLQGVPDQLLSVVLKIFFQ